MEDALYPPHRPLRRDAVIVSRDHSMTAYKSYETTGDESETVQWTGVAESSCP